MGTEIEIESETLSLLDKYCNPKIRPARLGAILSVIISQWYARAAKAWTEKPELIPHLEKIPESRKQKVMTTTTHGKAFKKTLEAFNKKMNTNIGEAELVTWLTKTYIKAFRIKQKTKGYKFVMGGIKRV